jgi:hypothetical protein
LVIAHGFVIPPSVSFAQALRDIFSRLAFGHGGKKAGAETHWSFGVTVAAKSREIAAMKALWMVLAFSAIASAAGAQPSEAPTRPIALQEFPPKEGAHLSVSSPAFTDGADIPFENTQYRGNVFPGLAWSG